MSNQDSKERIRGIVRIITYGTNRHNQPLYQDSIVNSALMNYRISEIAMKNEYEAAALVKFACLLGMRWGVNISECSKWEREKGITEQIAKEIELDDSMTLAALEYMDKSTKVRRKVKYFDLMDSLPIPFMQKGRKKMAGFDRVYIHHCDPYGSKKQGGDAYIPEQKMGDFRKKKNYYENNLQRRVLEMRLEVCGQKQLSEY